MDLHTKVQNKLVGGEKCICCLIGALVSDVGKENRVLALVCGQKEHGLFLYTPGQSSLAGDDLHLDSAIPISTDFEFNIISQPSGQTAASGSVPVRFTTCLVTLTFELLPSDQVGVFLAELKKARTSQLQTSNKGLPSTFSWISRYTNKQAPSSPNPFLNDIYGGIKQGNLGMDEDSQMSRSSSFPILDELTDSWSSNSSLNKLRHESDVTRAVEGDPDEVEHLRSTKAGRETMISVIMNSRKQEYLETHNFRIFCGTWNVNGQPPSESCAPWLSTVTEPPDIYAIGFQELDLSKNAYIFTASPREEEWYQKVKEGLPKSKDGSFVYRKLKLVRLVGMMLIIFIKEEHRKSIKNVEAETVPTGIMGMLGNKGGVGVRFDLHNTSLCFINSHQAAHTEEYERRNQDFRDVNAKMNFGNQTPPQTISDHDIVFWLGDLNYRLDEVDVETCKDLINIGSFEKLLGFDQLCRQMALKKVFLDYQEGNITFKPTYKYDVGTDLWDTSEKCRTPAWVDRVLWRGPRVEQIVYQSHSKLKLSDHKPVSSVFNVGIHHINNQLYKKVYEDTMKKLDRWENEILPQVELTEKEVRFEHVKFIEPQTKTIVARNTGQVPVLYEFIAKPNEDTYSRPWLTAKPNKGMINTGEDCDIQIEVYVDKSTASTLNSGRGKIEDILVLHLVGGKDFFITVSGDYVTSCFGSSIEELVYTYGPIRGVAVAQLVDLENSSLSANTSPSKQPSDRPLDVPKELWRLVDHLYKNCLDQENLFRQPGVHSEIPQIIDSLDTGVPSTLPGIGNSVAETLLLFVESLSDPIIPYNYYNKCLDCCMNFALCRQVLSQIPQCHRVCFKYLTAFLRTLLEHSNKNNLDAKFVATMFGGLFLRPPLDSSKESLGNRMMQVQNEERKKAAFVYHFLTNDYDE